MNDVTTINGVKARAQQDAYEHFGPLHAHHLALESGLRADSDDDHIDVVKERFLQALGTREPLVLEDVEVTNLGSALATWRDDLVELGRLA
jgi:hypothetical protein